MNHDPTTSDPMRDAEYEARAIDAMRWRWWLQHLTVEHDSDGPWTRWVAIPMICFRTQTESVNELTDALMERFPIKTST